MYIVRIIIQLQARSILKCRVSNEKCTMYSLMSIVYSVHCTLFTLHCTLYSSTTTASLCHFHRLHLKKNLGQSTTEKATQCQRVVHGFILLFTAFSLMKLKAWNQKNMIGCHKFKKIWKNWIKILTRKNFFLEMS